MDISRVAAQGDLESEQFLLRLVARDHRALIRISGQIAPAYFWSADYAKVYQALLYLAENGHTIDRKSLQLVLEQRGQWEDLAHVVHNLFVSYAVDPLEISEENALKSLIAKYKRRLILNQVARWHDDGLDASTNIDTIVLDIQQFLIDLRHGEKHYFTPDNLARHAVAVMTSDLEAARANNGAVGLQTGFEDLDDIIGGFRRGSLIVIGARPSIGKTAMMASMALNMAVKGVNGRKVTVGILSLEMPAVDIATRLVAAAEGIDTHAILSGVSTLEEEQRYLKALGTVGNFGITIDDTAGTTIQTIALKARQMALDQDVKIVFVDYLGKISSDAKSRYEEVSQVTRRLKDIAKQLNIPIVVLSQLSRATEHNADKRPKMQNLKESGEIEQEADIVMLLHRPEFYRESTFPDGTNAVDRIAVYVAKNRNGPVGDAILKFEKKFARVANIGLEDELPEPDTGFFPPERDSFW